MNNIRDLKKISFRNIEQTAFRIACKTQVKAMEISLKEMDDEVYKNRDKKRYKPADSICDYRVRLNAMGYRIKRLRPMGAAEAQMDRFLDRIKGRGQSRSPWGLDAMVRQ